MSSILCFSHLHPSILLELPRKILQTQFLLDCNEEIFDNRMKDDASRKGDKLWKK
jgi:hypothetical protein